MKERGATLVEVLVAIALAGVMLPTLATALITSHAGRASSRQQLQAAALMREATEAVRAVRDSGWSNIATDGTYHPTISGDNWALASGSETIGDFTRQVVISTAQRDSGGALVASGGINDPATKHIEVTVSWTTPYSSSISDDTYLSHWQGNAAWAQTTQADFASGTATNTAVTNSSGGEVELAAGTPTYQASGTFESDTFDAGANASFNFLTFTINQPAGTNLKFQIAANNDHATWTYIGPDGTGGTYFTSAASIPLSAASARYFRYKAFLTGDGTATPVLSDITLNYSP